MSHRNWNCWRYEPARLDPRIEQKREKSEVAMGLEAECSLCI